ncbi:ATP-dependent zinc metalloprotease YME1-like protein [Colletotrichum siamense]|uniref:ATP-dependent zinc metalloprotease YME1-like protein n=1 Tax=Colletotrichum siamense TaxID=690259 RepID=UPI001872FC2B|nr:ATP-dependent zinc metalloprotease YME1-like protein [Colletotrichum siamense]KAF5486637.1 ATP-dependent zinc metalloprotease YME1-like protein [Colletotrichum siamense]
MNPEDVINEFNKIIGPNFSLTQGRVLKQTDTGSENRCDASTHARGQTEGAGNAAHIAQSTLEESSGENDKMVLEDQELLLRRRIARNLHAMLFKTKEMIYIKYGPGSGAKVAEECAIVTSIEKKAIRNNDGTDDEHQATHVLLYVRTCNKGRSFGLTRHSIEIGSSSQEMTDQRVMLDGIADRKMRGAPGDNSFIAAYRGQGLQAFLSTNVYPMPHSRGPSSSQVGGLMGDKVLLGEKGKQKSSEYERTRGDYEWTDIDCLTCPPMLVAFLLEENIWVNVHVEHLTDIVWPENPFDSLELEIGKKSLIQNITGRFKTKEIREGSHQDTGGGLRGNLIIFLTGPPGVGKTLTAEVVAEEAQRPLYRISAGELKVDPSDLEKQLGDIFLLARRWGAIILIDEGDMLMTKRQASTPAQNATVTAFLRLIHTYDGLIFLTSTSEDIDTAFYDRIHATIKYVGLDETQRTNIWRRQLQRAIRSPEEHPSSSPWPEETYRLLGKVETNGRDIRNIVRTAEQLALGLSTELAMKHVVAAMRNFGGSDDNVGSICEKLEALEEKVGGDREQACDDDVKVSPTLNQ